jgi:hypothetical protein
VSRLLSVSSLVLIVGWLGLVPAQGQDDKKEPEIILKKRTKDDADLKKPAAKAEKEKDQEKEGKGKEKPKLPKLEQLPDESDNQGEDPAKIIERIKKNLAGTDERLEKKDPGAETNKLQDQIVKDLDELIKQQQDQNQSGGQASKSQQKSGSPSGSSGNSGSSSSSESGQKSSSGQKSASGQKDEPKGGSGQKPLPSPNDSKGGQSTAGMGQDPQGKSGKSGGLGGDKSQKSKNTVADLFKDIWGHLPQTKRLEMDAYSRERFMPRYEELLRQYYRTIAEQGRRKEGE